LKNRRGTYVITIQPAELGWITEADIIDERRPGPAEEVQERGINRKKLKLSVELCKSLEGKIANVILENMNAFAWSSVDIPRIYPKNLCYRLTMDKKVKLLVHRRRKFNEVKRVAIREETHKLFVVGHIRQIQYPEWLANVVMVKRENGKWKVEDMCRLHQFK